MDDRRARFIVYMHTIYKAVAAKVCGICILWGGYFFLFFIHSFIFYRLPAPFITLQNTVVFTGPYRFITHFICPQKEAPPVPVLSLFKYTVNSIIDR
jgi:hypothetical protein